MRRTGRITVVSILWVLVVAREKLPALELPRELLCSMLQKKRIGRSYRFGMDSPNTSAFCS